MMGAVRQAVATGRDWFDALDTSAIPQIVKGEEQLLDTYDKALDATDVRPEMQDMLLQQRAALKAQIDALRDG